MTVLDEFAAVSKACKRPDAKGYTLEVIKYHDIKILKNKYYRD